MLIHPSLTLGPHPQLSRSPEAHRRRALRTDFRCVFIIRISSRSLPTAGPTGPTGPTAERTKERRLQGFLEDSLPVATRWPETLRPVAETGSASDDASFPIGRPSLRRGLYGAAFRGYPVLQITRRIICYVRKHPRMWKKACQPAPAQPRTFPQGHLVATP